MSARHDPASYHLLVSSRSSLTDLTLFGSDGLGAMFTAALPAVKKVAPQSNKPEDLGLSKVFTKYALEERSIGNIRREIILYSLCEANVAALENGLQIELSRQRKLEIRKTEGAIALAVHSPKGIEKCYQIALEDGNTAHPNEVDKLIKAAVKSKQRSS